MRPTKLGTWTCPSGNSVDICLVGDGVLRQIQCAWDRRPLSVEDELFYTIEILPALTRRAQEYLERPGRALVVRVAP